MAPQRWKVPISIVAVNHIEVIDHIDWLRNELNVYDGGFEPLSPHADFSNLIWFCFMFCKLVLPAKMLNIEQEKSSLGEGMCYFTMSASSPECRMN